LLTRPLLLLSSTGSPLSYFRIFECKKHQRCRPALILKHQSSPNVRETSVHVRFQFLPLVLPSFWDWIIRYVTNPLDVASLFVCGDIYLGKSLSQVANLDISFENQCPPLWTPIFFQRLANLKSVTARLVLGHNQTLLPTKLSLSALPKDLLRLELCVAAELNVGTSARGTFPKLESSSLHVYCPHSPFTYFPTTLQCLKLAVGSLFSSSGPDLIKHLPASLRTLKLYHLIHFHKSSLLIWRSLAEGLVLFLPDIPIPTWLFQHCIPFFLPSKRYIYFHNVQSKYVSCSVNHGLRTIEPPSPL